MVSDYKLDDQDLISGRGKDFYSNLCLDRLWGPPSLLYNGYQGPFPGAKRGRGVTLTTPLSTAKAKNE
jgi:hypothetical protein